LLLYVDPAWKERAFIKKSTKTSNWNEHIPVLLLYT
jgi:hypothetical protein